MFIALFLMSIQATTQAPDMSAAACSAAEWRLMFVNGPRGEEIAGSREALLRALRRGSPVRVSWGEADAEGKWSVEEFANTTFVNIMGGRDVVAQIEPALIQSHYTEVAKAGLKTPLVLWRSIIATDGRFEAVTTNAQSGKQLRVLVQRTTVHWYALAPDPRCDARPLPDLAPRGRLNIIERDERADP